MTNKIKPIPCSRSSPLQTSPRNPHSIFLEPVDEAETLLLINSLKTNTASGHDCISSITLKTVNTLIVKPLTHIFNLCIQQGIFPDSLKKAIVIPIHKGGITTDLNNYRPISLTTQISKLLEKCIKNRLIKFLKKYNLISKHQFGFQESLGTDDAIYEITSLIYKNFDDSNKTIAIFLDLMKAFDTVKHDILLHK